MDNALLESRGSIYSNSMNCDINIVGTIPPPIGGVSCHVFRLCEVAGISGFSVCLFDLRPNPEKHFPENVHRCPGSSSLAVVGRYILWQVFRQSGLVHAHVSRVRPFIWLNAILLITGRRAVDLVTFHSGALEDDYLRLTLIERVLFAALLRRARGVVCVSERLSRFVRALIRETPDKVETIPAYLPQSNAPKLQTKATLSIEGFLGANSKAVLIASGYGTPLYGWEFVLRAVSGLSKDCKWILCFYNQYARPYYTRIRKMAEEHPNVLVLEDLSLEEFSWVLERASVYFRPTATDGDSVALREALSKGLKCVASDAVPRPASVGLFRLEDNEQMLSKLRQAVEGVPSGPAVELGGLTVIDLYRRILTLEGAIEA